METTEVKKSGKKTVLKVILFVLSSLILAAALTALSAVWPVYLQTSEDLFNVDYGWPFRFLNQVTTIVANDGYFPRYFVPQLFHASFDTVVYWDDLILSFFVWLIISAAALFAIKLLWRAYRTSHPKKIKQKKPKEEYRNVFD